MIDKEEIRLMVEQVLSQMGLFSAAAQAGVPAAARQAPADCPAAAIREGRVSGIPAEASARHVHLTQAALETLFGPGAVMGNVRPLSQPGEFLSDKRVKLVGPKGEIDNVAVLGPPRKAVQAELSMTDTRVLGVSAPLRVSGDLSGAADIDILGPAGTLHARAAVIVAANHLHLRPEDARNYGVKNGDFVRVRVKTRRPLVFEQVAVRVSDNYMPALHLDFDEANACMLGGQDFAEILDCGGSPGGVVCAADSASRAAGPKTPAKPALITELEAKRMVSHCEGKLSISKGSIITPSAKDVFLHAHCTVEFV